jgi:hypothetical protein
VSRYLAPRDVLPAVRTGSGYGVLRFLITLLHGVAFVVALLWFAAMVLAMVEHANRGSPAPLRSGVSSLDGLWLVLQEASALELFLAAFMLPCIVASRQASLLLIDIADSLLMLVGRALERGDDAPR